MQLSWDKARKIYKDTSYAKQHNDRQTVIHDFEVKVTPHKEIQLIINWYANTELKQNS